MSFSPTPTDTRTHISTEKIYTFTHPYFLQFVCVNKNFEDCILAKNIVCVCILYMCRCPLYHSVSICLLSKHLWPNKTAAKFLSTIQLQLKLLFWGLSGLWSIMPKRTLTWMWLWWWRMAVVTPLDVGAVSLEPLENSLK